MIYRIWNSKQNKFVNPETWYINGVGKIFYYDIMDGELTKCDDCVIQRFTELYDIDNNPIFEGDILINTKKDTKTFSSEFIVQYNFGRWILNDVNDLSDYWVDNTSIGNITNLKIIGNIVEKNKN